MTRDVQFAFEASTALINDAAENFKDPWWLIGSAAAKIAGAQIETINDIDLLLSVRDIKTMKECWRDRKTSGPTPSDQFRSAVFYCFDAPLPIEAMAGFELKTMNGDWKAIWPETRRKFGALYAPDIPEQIALLQLMNRRKDAPRIDALRALMA